MAEYFQLLFSQKQKGQPFKKNSISKINHNFYNF